MTTAPVATAPSPADLGTRTGGVWTRADALACGLSDEVIAHRVTIGYWRRLRRGVFCDGGVELSAAMRGWAAVLASGRAESPAESLCRLLLLPHLPGLVPQLRVRDSRGRIVARLDLDDERLWLAVEAEGRAGHEGAQMVAKDQRRDARTEDVGWRTERCTWFELRRQQAQLLRRVLRAADRQRAAWATSSG
jgi:hypothetical protein